MILRVHPGAPHGMTGASVRGSARTTYLAPDGSWVRVGRYYVRALENGNDLPVIEVTERPPAPPVAAVLPLAA